MLVPAAAFALGAWAAFHLSFLSLPLLSALSLVSLGWGLGLRRRAGIALGFVALGLLAAVVRSGLPERPAGGLVGDMPVEAVVRVSGHWSRDDEGWAAPARLLRWTQAGQTREETSLDVLVHLPDPDLEPPALGSTLRARGYLTRSSGFANRSAVPPGPWRIRLKSRLLMEVESLPGFVPALSGSLRRRVERAFDAAGPESRGRCQGKALARALVLGDAAGLPLEWKRGLRVTGLYHLMSVSGVHVALVAGLVWLLAGVGGWMPRSLQLLLMLAAIGLYLLLVGPLPPLVRAAVMGALAVLALLAERPPAAANALGWAAIAQIAIEPDLVNQPTFQLTASATAGILLLAPRLAERWTWGPHGLRSSLAASVGAQLATLPWILPQFHLLSPTAPLLNLLAVPWTGVALVASLFWTGLALIWPAGASFALPVLDALAAPFAWPSRVPPEVWGTLPLHVPAWGAWALAIALGGLLLMKSSRPWVRITRTVALILTLLTLAVWGYAGGRVRSGPQMVMIDVGQGDSILLRDGRRAILVDGGGWESGDLGGRVLLPALLAEGVTRLEALVMTHPDRDHCQGLVDISAFLPVREVWMGPGWDPESCAGRLAVIPGAAVRLLSRGDRREVGEWRLTVLHPDPDERRGENERSLVLLAQAAGHRVLLTGDVESWAEQRLLSCCEAELRADILKVAHHGSRTSTSESFLEAVRPRLALISVGQRNVYHHPSPVVVERLQEHGVRVLRTDRDGAIAVSWGEHGQIRIELPGSPR